jgi:hypothetical protein
VCDDEDIFHVAKLMKNEENMARKWQFLRAK